MTHPAKAITQRMIQLIIGIGLGCSATIGAKIVLNLPATLQNPITNPKKELSK